MSQWLGLNSGTMSRYLKLQMNWGRWSLKGNLQISEGGLLHTAILKYIDVAIFCLWKNMHSKI